MTKKSLDRQNRFRSKTYGFRLSPEENEVLERMYCSGLTKQDYLIHCIEHRVYVIEGHNSRVYKALKN
ncbi:MAG: hypothetical protein ACLRHW_07240 [Coprobacillus cateniformis]